MAVTVTLSAEGAAQGKAGIKVVEGSAPAVREAFAAFANGTPKEDVLQHLKAHGLAGRGAPNTFKALDRMLRNALYAGRVEMPKWGPWR